jgi:hypothetical protein
MPLRQLTEEELGETLQRAREISAQTAGPVLPDAELQAYLQAGEEVGVPQEALLQALRERQLAAPVELRVGELAFAPSADGHLYPAEVLALTDHTASVRFVSGAEHTCARIDLRPLALVPGRKLEADIADWGWWGAIVEKYNPEKRKVDIVHDDWTGTKETVPLHRLRLTPKAIAPPQRKTGPAMQSALMKCALLAGGVGVAAGILLDRLLPLLLPFLR